MAAAKKSEEERIKELEDMTPELPEDFEKWCGNKFSAPKIYYKRKGNYTDCICGECGKRYEIYTPRTPEYGTMYEEIPERGARTVCKECGNVSTYEWQRITSPVQQYERRYLYQLAKDNSLIVRIFTCYRRYSQYSSVENWLMEESRYFLSLGKVEKLIRTYTYRKNEYAWLMSDRAGYPYIEIQDGDIYPGWRETVQQSQLKYCPVDELAEMQMENWGKDKFNTVSLTDALMTYANNPAIEMYCKMGLYKMARALSWKEGRIGDVNRKKDTLQGQLRLKKKEHINQIIKAHGDVNLLKTLQFEEKQGYTWKQEQEEWVAEIMDSKIKGRLRHLLQYMTLQQLMNRTEKYARQKNGESFRSEQHCAWKESVLREYDDYLSMREELGYDMTNSVFLYPRDLEQAHDQMVKESNARRDELYVKKKKKEFPNIAKRYESLCKRYQAAVEGYIIRPAKDAGEIIMEGRTLHHCVGGDNYLSKHNKGQTAILFLRKEKTPNTPYITIEIDGTKIRQWYGAHDRKPKQEFFDELLSNYIKQLEDRKKKQGKTLTAAV